MKNHSITSRPQQASRPLHLTLFGATGAVGSRILAEALARGHQVTAAVRDPDRCELPDGVRVRKGDVTRDQDVAELGRDQDAVISATRPPAGQENRLVTMTRALLRGTSRADVRLLLVGGAARLVVPGTGGRTVIDDPAYCPPTAQAIARACLEQLAACHDSPRANWTYLSPPALLKPGQRTGHYRQGTDTLVTDSTGQSMISMEDFAVALLDEIEHPGHVGERFTVAY